MAKRHDDALYIQGGAVNPIAVTNTLQEAVQAMRDDGHDMTEIKNDAAIRLIIHQLAHICGMDCWLEMDLYDKHMKECRMRASPKTLAMLKY